METLWFIILSCMFTIYIVMDGFDFGAGIIHLFVARGDREKKLVLRSIGPFWDGNEVWLVAGGGVLFFAFPLLYAVSFSGFYLALILVLWLFILRGISLELRNHLNNEMWKGFFDVVFGIASLLLALFFGVALGNVVRGVNLGGVVNGVSHFEPTYFFTPLWTNFLPGENPGVLDWFTVIMGLIGVLTLAIHGGNWIILKSSDPIQERIRKFIKFAWVALVTLVVVSIISIAFIRASIFDNYLSNNFLVVFPLVGFAALVSIPFFIRRKDEFKPFLASTVFIVAMLVSTALGLYPTLLPSASGVNLDITIYNSASTAYGLGVAIKWWIIAIILTIGYFIYTHRIFKGKISQDESIYEGH
jgi:cytochrome d ubiquinol oxidase subunit II